MKKNNKAFTLIEVLIVIAIISFILVLVIISLNKISKDKKKESYEKVKNQVEIAAKQYVETNGYLFEDLNPNGSSKSISVGELVEGDYLNTLTNPVTGKKLHKCSNVIVTRKSQNKYTYKFDDTKNKCETITTIVTESKQNKPKIEITKTSSYVGKLEPKDDWYNNTIYYTVKGIENGGSKIKSVSAYSDSSYTNMIASDSSDTLTFQRTEDTSGTTLYFKVVNESGTEVTKEDSYKLDTTSPSLVISKQGATNEDRKFSLNYKDTMSGIRETKYKIGNKNFVTYDGDNITALTNTGSTIVEAETYDIAGNKTNTKDTLICNKDKVRVEQGEKGCNFTLKLSTPDNPGGIVSNNYEYVVWNIKGTNDSTNNHGGAEDAKRECTISDMLNNSSAIVSDSETKIIEMKTGTKKMYYCFAVRPKRNDRNNLTGIGNYFRNELVLPNSPNKNNTGWTIEYKHAICS